MKAVVKPERLSITVELNGKLFSFPGEWASNFGVDQRGELVRKNSINRFYVDRQPEISIGKVGMVSKQISDEELQECIGIIQSEAKKNGWQVIWPDEIVH